jgi:RTX calcium-binding nonapeptide repeat (4 copies)
MMIGGAGNDVYFVDNAGDVVVENPNEGNDVVFSTAHFQLPENVETLVLQGNADLQGYGNSGANALFGNNGSNLLDGRAGADTCPAAWATTSTSSTMQATSCSRTPAKETTRYLPPSTTP